MLIAPEAVLPVMDASPVLRTICRVVSCPAEAASAVRSDIAPLALMPEPVVMLTAPPATEDGAVVPPADRVMAPPTPVLLAPTVTPMAPPLPPVPGPEES